MSCPEEEVTVWPSHRRGDYWDGNLWLYTDPVTGDPYDLTGHRFDLHFRKKPESETAGWELSTEGDDPGMALEDGDGSIVTLPNGREVVFEEAGFPWGVRALPRVPPLTVAKWYGELEHLYPDDQPITEESVTWQITQDVTRPT